MKIITAHDMVQFGAHIGRQLRGGEIIELVGDVGTGKTTFTKGIAMGLDIDEDVVSPTFTISREYQARDAIELHHYDFYRLLDPGVVKYELAESIANPSAVTIIEWGGTTHDVLPPKRIVIQLTYTSNDDSRSATLTIPTKFSYIKETT